MDGGHHFISYARVLVDKIAGGAAVAPGLIPRDPVILANGEVLLTEIN